MAAQAVKSGRAFATVLIPQAMPYQGSKRKMAETILGHFPNRMARIVEPFAGSAAVSIRAVASGMAGRAWISDAHAPLVSLWREILYRPDALADGYAALWSWQLGNEREFYDMVRARFNRTHGSADFLYLLARSAKAAVRFNRSGGFNHPPDNRRRGAEPDAMGRRIRKVGGILRGKAHLTALDYKAVLASCVPQDVVYLDPSYQGTSGRNRRYHGDFSHDELHLMLADLVERRVPFALSYDGMTGSKAYGSPPPKSLGLRRVMISGGRSTQSTLLGRAADTHESLYISPHVDGAARRLHTDA